MPDPACLLLGQRVQENSRVVTFVATSGGTVLEAPALGTLGSSPLACRKEAPSQSSSSSDQRSPGTHVA